MPLSLFLLGPPRVEIDGEVITFPRQKSLALLVYLAVTGEPQRRDTLAALLWPESEDARGALRRELSSLKSALGDGDWLDADRENVTLTGDVWLDVGDFLTAVESDDPSQLTQAADLYRGDFLSGFSLADAPDFDDWRFFQGEEYRRLLAAGLERLIAHHESAHDPAAAIPFARRLLDLDNLHEPSHRILMRLYALAGQQAAALRQYDECVRLLDEELGVPPEEDTNKLHQAIRTRRVGPDDKVKGWQGDKATSPPHPVTPPSPLHNLPPQATLFMGREREVAEVGALLAGQANRLVTITGVGGIGKSRLGLAVAERVLPDFPDGVWFVPLATLETAEALPRAIAAALSASVGGADARGPLFAFLHPKRLLLLLDNFEHLLEGADFLAELLPHAPGVKLLVTSQERLNLLEESLYPLGGLSLESDGAVSSALTLFEQTAQRVQPDFSLAKEKADVTAICQAVEGMPLAIELAAGWVRVMACAAIAAEIQRSVDFLSTSLRNLPARHRSLRAVFERSWALLGSDEQRLLARLSVFQGGFTRQAATAVADATPARLAGLVDHSFLRRQTRRFDMHGLMHRFTAEQLAADPAVATDTRNRHANFYADLVAQAGWELKPGDPAASAAADRDGPNVLAAWRWGVENRDASVVGRMMRWLVDYFRRRGDYSGGEVAFESAIQAFRATDGEAQNAGLLGSLLLRLGKCIFRERKETKYEVIDEAIVLLRHARPEHPLDLAQALVAMGMNFASLGRNPEGEVLLTEAIVILREAGNELGVGATLRDLGMLEGGQGRLIESQRHFEESVQVLQALDRKSHLQSTFLLGTGLMQRGHYRRAEALLRRALPFFVEQGENGLAGFTLRNLADLYTATGDFVQANRYFTEAYVRFEPVGLGYEITGSNCLSPAALARLSGKSDAETRLLDAVVTAREIGFQQRIATSLHHLARLRHDQRDYEGALALLDEALTIARKIDFRYATALALTAQGHSRLALKETDAARVAYAEALEIAEREGIDRVACDALVGVAQLAHQQGDSQLALSLLTFAHSAEASEWETKRRAERLLAELPQEPTRPPIPSLEEAIRHARAALDEGLKGWQGDKATSPPHPVTPSPGHLPIPTTSFIGRETELAELAAFLARPDVRLATVVAPGGMGKTRFAIETARRLAGDYPDGVWFLSLVGVNESAQMLSALVQLLDAPMGAGGTKEALLRYFAQRRLLLVLDNFEQLVNAAPVLAELLAGGPGVKLLVTSRARLNLREEWAFPLAGLTTTEGETEDGGTKDERTQSGPAVRLFVERARQVQPDFDAEAGREAVAAICRVVEGMPLAIELAASWLRAMNCEEIAVEIRRDVDFLSTPLRNVPEQHRSMRAVFERSWGLLTPEEKQGLARLSVFQGGFTRAAAQAVAEVRLPLLSTLVDHSLLRHSATGRYDIHELLRQFAAEQLDKSESAEIVRDRHADYFLRLLSERRADLEWRRLQEALDELIPERENLFAGWRWACERALFPPIRTAAKALPLYCNLTSAQENGLQLFNQAIAAVEAKASPEDDRPGLLGILRWRQQCYLQHPHNQPDAYLERLFATRTLLLESEADVQNELARMSGAIGTQLATVGKGDEGAQWMENAIRHFTERRAFVDLGKVYCRFALLRLGEGKLFQSDEIFGRAADAWRQAQLPAYPLIYRSSVYQQQGRFDEALRLLEQAREMGDDPFTREFAGMSVENSCYDGLSQACVALGVLDKALVYFERIREMSEAEGRPWDVALSSLYTPGTILRLRGQMQSARREIENEVAIVRSVGFKQRIVARLEELARLEYDEGNYAVSEATLREALEIAEAIDSRLAKAFTLCLMGHTATAQGKPDAAGFYRRALEIAAEQGMNGIVVDVLQGAAGLTAQSGDVAQAVEWLALAASHPNGEWETKQKAQKALARLEGQLSAEDFSAAQARGRAADLEKVIQTVQARLS